MTYIMALKFNLELKHITKFKARNVKYQQIKKLLLLKKHVTNIPVTPPTDDNLL